MARKKIELPTVRILDEWTKEIDGIEITFQIKMTSGGDKPTWYPVTCWKADHPTFSVGGKFEEMPSRDEVELHFEHATQQ